jgi:Mrp family chromosome partitioning ATPase
MLAVRSESDLIAALGPSHFGARPLQREGVRTLAEQLLEHWRSLVPVISPRAGEGRTALAIALARKLAALGARTLLVDADLRRPSIHERLGVPNERGLADLLEGRDVRLAPVEANLAVLPAGRSREYPLELLSRPRLRQFFQAAARPFRAVVIDTPAAARGPDFEIFAALAGGALVVVRPGEDARVLSRLARRLAFCRARPITALFRS